MKCKYCGTDFIPNTRGRKNTGFCSKSCGEKWRYHNAVKIQPHNYARTCGFCGQRFLAKNEMKEYCSISCASKARMQTFQYTRVCPVCGESFQADNPGKIHCSDECSRRATRDREQEKRKKRRAITGDQKDNKLSLDKVYQEAKGICSICGLPVPKQCDRNDEWSRTRDHIIPISRNGSHTYGNCQLAHRICNSIKKQEGEGFHIDWASLFESNPDKWESKLIRLDELLCAEKAVS